MSMYPPPPGGQGQAPQPGPGAPYSPPPADPYAQQPPYQQQYPHAQAQPPYAESPHPQPTYSQPQQDQAPYGQAPYAPPQQPGQAPYPPQQPGYEQPGAPGWGYPAPAKRSRKGLYTVLGAVGALILIGGGTVAYFAVQAASELGTYKLVPPASFQGMPEDKSNAVVQQLISSMANSDMAGKGATPVADGYSKKIGDRLPQVAFDGGYGSIADVNGTIDSSWSGFSDAASGNTVTQKTDESAGPLGGRLQCAIGTYGANDIAVPICTWVDHSSVVVVEFVGQLTRAGAASAAEFPQDAATTLALRSAMEVKK